MNTKLCKVPSSFIALSFAWNCSSIYLACVLGSLMIYLPACLWRMRQSSFHYGIETDLWLFSISVSPKIRKCIPEKFTHKWNAHAAKLTIVFVLHNSSIESRLSIHTSVSVSSFLTFSNMLALIMNTSAYTCWEGDGSGTLYNT